MFLFCSSHGSHGESRWETFTSHKIGKTSVHYDDVQLWPAQQEGHAFGGLLVVRSYDLESGLFWDDSWEIWHQETGLFLLELRAPLGRSLEIATDLARKAEWSIMNEHDVDSHPVRFKLMAFASGYPNEVLMTADDIDNN